MRFRTLTLALIGGMVAFGAFTPSFADDDWRWHERNERERWRQHEWREHEWREHQWREHEWRERFVPPPVVVTPPYGYYAPPPPPFVPYPFYYR